MSVSDFLGRVIERLEAAEIPHMLAGSFASSYHGQMRTTYDIDLVIAPTRASLLRFIETLHEED